MEHSVTISYKINHPFIIKPTKHTPWYLPNCVCAQLLSCVQLCDPMDCSTQGSPVCGIISGKNTGVGSLVRELKSHKPRGTSKIYLFKLKMMSYLPP